MACHFACEYWTFLKDRTCQLIVWLIHCKTQSVPTNGIWPLIWLDNIVLCSASIIPASHKVLYCLKVWLRMEPLDNNPSGRTSWMPTSHTVLTTKPWERPDLWQGKLVVDVALNVQKRHILVRATSLWKLWWSQNGARDSLKLTVYWLPNWWYSTNVHI